MQALESKILRHPFLHGMAAEHQRRVAECAVEKVFEPGDVIFSEGAVADHFYLIQEGLVQLACLSDKQRLIPIQTLGPADVLGWSWLFAPYLCHYSATALERTKTICLSGAHLLNCCEKDHHLGYELMKRFSQVMIGRLQATRQKFLENLGAAGPA